MLATLAVTFLLAGATPSEQPDTTDYSFQYNTMEECMHDLAVVEDNLKQLIEHNLLGYSVKCTYSNN